jgi:uncharacterized protein (TIGR03118 family)
VLTKFHGQSQPILAVYGNVLACNCAGLGMTTSGIAGLVRHLRHPSCRAGGLMNTWWGAHNRIAVVAMAGTAVAAIGLLAFTSAEPVKAQAATGFYRQTNLVSDQPGVAPILDPNLVNPWGISLSPAGGAFWVANNGTSTATLYTGDVNGSPFVKAALTVTIPGGSPTGTVFNSSADFVVRSGASSGRAIFLFASQTGFITGWNPAVPPPTLAHVGATANAVYTGLAIGSMGGANFLYAADFENGRIDVYDKDFQLVQLDGSFSDPNVPNSYSPFNIQNLGGNLYVAYAQQNHKEPDEETGHGSGFVSVFDTSGHLLQRLVLGNHLNAPWGLALAPSDFGPFSDALLVGNFGGNGYIQAFDPTTGRFLGRLEDASGHPIVIDGLWGLAFGNGVSAGDRNALYFAAGPDDETHGLFGSLRFVG